MPIEQRRIKADATEAALFRYSCEKLGNSALEIRENHEMVCEIPFNSENKWMLTVHHYPHHQGTYRIFIKGAPEKVFNICNSIKIKKTVIIIKLKFSF